MITTQYHFYVKVFSKFNGKQVLQFKKHFTVKKWAKAHRSPLTLQLIMEFLVWAVMSGFFLLLLLLLSFLLSPHVIRGSHCIVFCELLCCFFKQNYLNVISKWSQNFADWSKESQGILFFIFCGNPVLTRLMLIGMVFMIIREMLHGRIILNLVLLLLVSFVSGFRLEWMYIFITVNVRSSLTHLHGFHLLVLLPQFIEVTFLVCTSRISIFWI